MAAKKKTTKKKSSIFDPIKPKGGVAGRRNPNAQSQLDEFGNPRNKSTRKKK